MPVTRPSCSNLSTHQEGWQAMYAKTCSKLSPRIYAGHMPARIWLRQLADSTQNCATGRNRSRACANRFVLCYRLGQRDLNARQQWNNWLRKNWSRPNANAPSAGGRTLRFAGVVTQWEDTGGYLTMSFKAQQTHRPTMLRKEAPRAPCNTPGSAIKRQI